MLRKALVRFPKGTPRRWAAVASVFDGLRTEEDVRKKIALLVKNARARREAGAGAAAGGGAGVAARDDEDEEGLAADAE